MKLTVYNRENSRPAEVNYQGKRTINLNRTGAIYLSKTLSVEMGIAGDEGVNFANDEETGGWYICRTTDKSGFTVWKDKRCARFSSGFMAHKLMEQAKVECKSVQFMVAKMPVEMDGIIYYKIILSNPIVR